MSDHPEAAPQGAPPPHPFRLSLEQQRNRARELLRAWRAGDPAALQRLRRHHPRLDAQVSGAKAPPPRLSEAQLAIARELGLPSWPRLKAHIEAMRQARVRIAAGGTAPDAGLPTLHLRCGSDIAAPLRAAGFTGEFLEYSDPLCCGPVPATPDWLEQRADFLTAACGAALGLERAAIAGGLQASEDGLARAARHARVVLWFEHDSHDQLILARCLAAFAAAPPARLELVSLGHYPGSTRFIGLGQLPPEALRLLWETRQPLGEAALREGEAAWAALRAPDPRPLAALARQGTPALPPLAIALRRHCQELPWREDALGLTERLTLRLLAEQPRGAAEAFRLLNQRLEPLPFLGDLLYLDLLRRMQPLLVEPTPPGEDPWQAVLRPGAAGLDRLRGTAAKPHPVSRAWGGLTAGSLAAWRWDDARGEALPAN